MDESRRHARSRDYRHRRAACARCRRTELVLFGALDRRVHSDIVAPLIAGLAAERKVIACSSHARLALEFGRPMAEFVAMPRTFRLERRQAEPFPDRSRPLHEFALG